MKRELQIVLLASIFLSLYCMGQMWQSSEPAINKHIFSGVATWQPPRVSNVQQIAQTAIPEQNPFSRQFFEDARLKGFIKNGKNEWCAIFSTVSGDTKMLEPGISVSGLTLVSSNGRYCRVKFGSVIREFSL